MSSLEATCMSLTTSLTTRTEGTTEDVKDFLKTMHDGSLRVLDLPKPEIAEQYSTLLSWLPLITMEKMGQSSKWFYLEAVLKLINKHSGEVVEPLPGADIEKQAEMGAVFCMSRWIQE